MRQLLQLGIEALVLPLELLILLYENRRVLGFWLNTTGTALCGGASSTAHTNAVATTITRSGKS